MADSTLIGGTFQTSTNQESEKCKNNSSAKLQSKYELKSSIPKPTLYVRSRETGKLTVSSSCHSQPMHFSKIPLPTYRSRGKTSASLQYRAASISNPSPNPSHKTKLQSKGAKTTARSTSPKIKPALRPKSASVVKNPYYNVKAKIDSKLPTTTKLKKQFSPTNVNIMKSDESNAGTRVASYAESDVTDQSMEDKTLSNDEILDKQRQLLSIYSELRKVQPARDLQPLEREICLLMQNKTLGHLDNLSKENSFLLTEGSPEFLSTFEKQMHEVSESWLQLMCDLISTKLLVGNPALARLSLPDPTLNLREEVYRFLNSLPADGDPLPGKLKKVEEEQLKVMTVVMHSVMALSKQHEDLKDKHFRLEKTQDQIHYELKEEIAILGEENKELDRKYSLAVEKYNLEKSKVEQQEKHKITIHKDMSELKKIMKFMEGKCLEWENKVKKMDSVCRSLEVAVRNKEVALEKEGKHNRDLIIKFNESKDTIKKLKSELEESNQERISLEMTNNELKNELVSIKASFEENLQKRNELVEELSSKTKKLNETEVELDLIRTYVTNSSSHGSKDTHDITSNVLIEDLTKDIHQRNLQIQELKKKMNHMEHILKEKSTREDMLMRQVTELQKQPHEHEVALRTEIKELQYVIKDLTEEKKDLEKIIAQKTLELDQRDLLMQQHSRILRSRDELIPMIQNKQRNEEECIERLRAVVFEQEKTYFSQANNGFFNREEPNLKEAMKALESRNDIDPKMVDKELTFRQEKMTELFNLLENKQMEMMRLERRLRELQGVQQEKEIMEREKEARISSLQKEIQERKANKARGFFSLFSGQDVPSC